jgi:hypothetical protein
MSHLRLWPILPVLLTGYRNSRRGTSRRKACDSCSRSKVRCNFSMPCTRCVDQGKECLYSQGTPLDLGTSIRLPRIPSVHPYGEIRSGRHHSLSKSRSLSFSPPEQYHPPSPSTKSLFSDRGEGSSSTSSQLALPAFVESPTITSTLLYTAGRSESESPTSPGLEIFDLDIQKYRKRN